MAQRMFWSLLCVGIAGAAVGACSGGGGDPPLTCPEREAHLCTIAYACDGDCGGLSPLDDTGCLRPLCTSDDECEGDATCYTPGRWGGCFHADTLCADVGDACECEGASGCATGSFCVANAELPERREIQSGPASIADTCMPGGGPGVLVMVGDPTMDGAVTIQIWEPAPLAPGEYPTSGGATFCTRIDGEANCARGVLIIDTWENGLVSGSFRGIVRGFVEGSFVDAPYTASAPMCNTG